MTRLSRTEFVALLAMMFATVAVSIDAMLPALPAIGAELSPDTPNSAQFILSAFVLGLGLGTFFTGPLSDALGRKPVILCGFALFLVGSFLAWLGTSLELTLVGRVIQGLGAAAPRIVGLAIVRDLYKGREMAQIMSLATMIFTLFPAVGPLIGSLIIAFSDWRGIFAAFILFGVILSSWTALRLPESLASDSQRPLQAHLLVEAFTTMMRTRVARIAMIVQSLCMGALFSTLILVQPIYDVTFGRAESFPLWFGLVALISASGAAVNALLVVRIGMKTMVTTTLAMQAAMSLGIVVAELILPAGTALFALFVVFQTTLFFMAGTTLGNLQALAMEPLGHIAGLVASVMGGVSTIFGVMIGATAGQLFAGNIWPLSGTVVLACVTGLALMLRLQGLTRSEPA